MIVIGKLQDLERHGVVALTGEADALMLRILCDLTEKGRRAFAKAFGLPLDVKLSENWNSKSSAGVHVGSVLLNCDELKTLSIFCLLESGCTAVYTIHPRKSLSSVVDKQRELIRNYQTFVANTDPTTPMDDLHTHIRSLEEDVKAMGLCRHWHGGCIYGSQAGDSPDELIEYQKLWESDGWYWRRFSYNNGPQSVGDRNTHQFSGRTV